MYTIRKILHPTDFSEQAAAAFRLASSLAKQHGAEVVVLHVVPPPVAWGEAIAREPPDSYKEELWNEYMLPIRSPEPGVQVLYRMEEGIPADLIATVAEDIGCDLIVMGTHGRTGLRRLFMGSVAEQVLRTAPCPVLTIREALPGFVHVASAEKQPASRPAVAG
jgi:nucleotide-binding universal stress UspA family protein